MDSTPSRYLRVCAPAPARRGHLDVASPRASRAAGSDVGADDAGSHANPDAGPGATRDANRDAGLTVAGAAAGIPTITSRWIERHGRPWFPITGEIHYSRIPRERWEETLAQARAGGLNSVATYVFWRHHEPTPGRFRFSGNQDLREFVLLAARHGLDVVVRLGPWAHGEARHGGFPDWVVEWAEESGARLRTDDPEYLRLVRRFYAETIAQLEGLAVQGGGPVIAAQVENELYDQPEHLRTLRRMAEELGLHVPLWTATGWGGAQVPESLLPVYSAYADGFWAGPEEEWPHFSEPHYTHRETRDDLGTGEDVRQALATADGPGQDAGEGSSPSVAAASRPDLPFVTCEMGGGMHVAYHRRPRVTGPDIAALALIKLGSGSVWQGYYMYAGGSHPPAAEDGVAGDQESQATGYPNDLPQVSYDFYAPIGEHGQIRPHHHGLRRQHLWLAEEGERLAQMTTEVGHAGQKDLRWAVRSDGTSGYLFVSTYQPERAALPGRDHVQFTVEFDDGVQVTVPSVPVDVPSGVCAAWPLRLPLAPGVVLRSATAQLVTRVSRQGDDDVVVLVASEGVPPELVVEGRPEVQGPVCTRVHHEPGGPITVVTPESGPGMDCVVRLPGVEVLLLDESSADQLYVLELAGRRRLLFSEDPLYVLPAEGEQPEALVRLSERRHSVVLQGVSPDAVGRWPRAGGPSGRLGAPADFAGAAVLRPQIPQEAFEGTHRLLLRVDFSGDVARAWIGDRLISDHFWHGRVWDMDLTPWRGELSAHGLRLEFLPWIPEAGVWVDPAVRDAPAGVHVRSAELVRVERTLLTAG